MSMRIEIFLYDLSAALLDLSAQILIGTETSTKTDSKVNPAFIVESLLQPDDAQALSEHPKRRLLQMVSRHQRRQILANALNQPAQTLVFSQTVWGKPTILHHEQLGFNQSHSQSMYSLAWSHEVVHLGIDIEDKSRTIKSLELAQRILTAAEYQYFLQAHDPQAYVLKLWTIKEAVLKAAGLGIRLNLNTLETGCETVQQQRGVARHPQIGHWDYACYALAQHLLCVSWPAQSDSTKIQIVFSHASA